MDDSSRRDSVRRGRDPQKCQDNQDNGDDAPPRESHPTPRRTTPWNTLSARVIAIVSRKGGVGKTTSAVNLGAALALSGHTVLVVGIDPQCGVCRTLGKDPADLEGSLLDVFRDHRSLVHVAQTSPLKNLFFASPGVLDLEDEREYQRAMRAEADTFVAEIDRGRNLYDTILIDCPPSLNAPTRAALLASDSFLVPVQAEELCRESVAPLLDFVDSFRNGFDLVDEHTRVVADTRPHPLELEGLFLTMVNSRTRMGRHVTARVQEEHGDSLLSASIPRTVRLSDMALRGKPAVIYDRRSPGSRAYFDLADELVERFCLRADVEMPQPVFHATEPEAALENAEPRLRLDASGSLRYEAAAGSAMAAPRLGGLDRLFADLQPPRGEADLYTTTEEPHEPEMVSLDELLAEEERGAQGRDDEV